MDHCSGFHHSSGALLQYFRISLSRLHLFRISGGILSSPYTLPSVMERFALLYSSFVNSPSSIFNSWNNWSLSSSRLPKSGDYQVDLENAYTNSLFSLLWCLLLSALFYLPSVHLFHLSTSNSICIDYPAVLCLSGLLHNISHIDLHVHSSLIPWRSRQDLVGICQMLPLQLLYLLRVLCRRFFDVSLCHLFVGGLLLLILSLLW